MALALRVMPMGETVAIIYLVPIGVMGLAAWRLGGKGAAAGMGRRFGGVLDPVALQPAAAVAGHFLFTAACREAPASVLALVNYCIWSGPGCWEPWCSAITLMRSRRLAWPW